MAVDPKPTKTGELLAAYVDGVGEMDVEERRRVERYLAEPGAREEQAATRDLIDQLREIREPEPQVDWSAMERAIHAEVGDEVPKRSLWSRSPARLAAAFALAAAAAILFLVLRGEADEASPIVFVPKPPAQTQTIEEPVFEQLDDRVTVYLDGTDLEIELDSVEEADEVDAELDELALLRDLEDADVGALEASLGFLEPTDLAWIDELDDDALARAERELERSLRRKGS